MTAFGPFAKKTEIDFSVLNEHSLFLITGPTGSGKTTILDAMTFALFGEASGDMRLTENFKSDYSDLNELCCVSLEFQLRGKRYVVERYPKQKRISARKNNIVVINSKAKLTLDDGEEIVGVENVNQKVVELFGLTYKQFKQIVILPQGEFKKLLEAKSEEKQEIFRKIFDTDIYEKFCKVLLEKTKEIEKRIESQKLLIESYIGMIDIKDDDELKESVDEYFLNKSENKETNLNLLVLKLENNIERNKKFSQDKKSLIDELERKKNKINNELTSIKILEDKKLRLSEAEHKVSEKIKMENELKIKLEDAKIKLDKFSEKKSHITDLIYEKNKLNNRLEYFNELNNLKNEYKLNLDKKNKIDKNIELLELAKKKLELEEEIKTENDILLKLNELILSIDVYINIYREYELSQREYLINYEKFLAGQAGFLAEKLADNNPCPVCGSIYHPKKAVLLKDTPSESYVNSLSLKTKKLRDKIANLDLKLSESYNFIKDKFVEIGNIKYKDILKNKDELINIFDKYRTEVSEKKKEINNIDVNIINLNLEVIKQNIIKSSEDKLIVDVKITSLKNDINNCKLKLDSEESEETIYLKIRNIDKQILDIESQYKFFEEGYNSVKESYYKNNQEIKYLINEIENLKLQLEESEFKEISSNLDNLKLELSNMDEKLDVLRDENMILISKLNINIRQYENIKNILNIYQKLYDKYSSYAFLSDVSNGKNPKRISFERYILASYFQDVIGAANVKFLEMTGYRYLLKRKEDKEKNNRASGLDLEIIDNYTGKSRNINTLSGGESFKASLCLALGLAEVVQMNSGGIEIDTLFIDEGFGTLDIESLDSTIEALISLKKTGRLIGIISHVNELKDYISAKLVVNSSKTGSNISFSF